MRSYKPLLSSFSGQFGHKELSSLTTDSILAFLKDVNHGTKQSTKKLRYSLLSAFFNFIRNSIDPAFQNPCDSPILKKLFRHAKPNHWKIVDKDDVDELIFRTEHPRNRLILELMARCGMRVGEVLKITPNDVDDRKVIIRDPKSGKEGEVVFLSQKVAERLKAYIRDSAAESAGRIFPISYPAARMVVKKAGELVGIDLRPHDLRRFAATYASRAGTPLEIVSKIILRHSNLATTQRYLGEISEIGAMSWIDRLHS